MKGIHPTCLAFTPGLSPGMWDSRWQAALGAHLMTLGPFLFRLEPVISSVSWNKQCSFPGSVCGKNLIEVVGMKALPTP